MTSTIQQFLKEHGISEVEAIIPDMAGVPRGKLMPAENTFCDEVIRMALMSLRELSPSMAVAISVIMGTVSTLWGGLFSVMRAMNVLVSNCMNL